MSFSILGLGTAVPPNCVSQEDALEMSTELICEDTRQQRLLRTLFRKSGVENRHTVIPWKTGYAWKRDSGRGPTTAERMRLYTEHAAPLARRAAAKALEEAEIDHRNVTHLITVSCTGFDAPGVDVDLIQSLGLRPTTQRVHVGYMGCHGVINALRVARGLAASEPNACILLCAVELCSLHYRLTWDDEGIKGNALFADGAAALVGANRAPARSTIWNVRGTGSCLIPDSVDEMSWRIGDHGFEMRLTSRVPALIEEHLNRWMSAWLDGFGQTIDTVGTWAVHPGGPKIVDAVENALCLPANACSMSRQVLRQLGNMSSPTVLFILDRLRRSEPALPIVALGFGPGLTAEAALLGCAD
ncbi:MAG: type III polyketide synthase [Planctomycetes bacterium]|nr:type III polyketide synthase [Planctomycetota bacterium]